MISLITIVHPVTGRVIEPGETDASRAVHARLVTQRTLMMNRHVEHQATVRTRAEARRAVREAEVVRRAAEAARRAAETAR